MVDDIKLALLGNKEAAKRLTEADTPRRLSVASSGICRMTPTMANCHSKSILEVTNERIRECFVD